MNREELKVSYTLNCDKCGIPYISKEAFPVLQQCKECFKHSMIKRKRIIVLTDIKELAEELIAELEIEK